MRLRTGGWARLGSAWGLALLLGGCVEAPGGRSTPSLLDAQGTGAAIIGREWWILLAVGTAIFLLVVGLMGAAIVRGRRGSSTQRRRGAEKDFNAKAQRGKDAEGEFNAKAQRGKDAEGEFNAEAQRGIRLQAVGGAEGEFNAEGPGGEVRDTTPAAHAVGDTRWIWLGGVALPLVVLLGVFALNVSDIRALGAPPSPAVAAVWINGHRWWWEVEYPDLGFKTANQLYIPVGQAVQVQLESADVIHSFWVPQLQFKRDLIPGQANTMWLQADRPGVYRALCAEFCGLQHAQMHMMVVALPPAEYAQWVAHEGEGATVPGDPLAQAGQQVFLGTSCVYCHAIRGTPAAGEVGPDLTHLASRLTLAAGSLENNTGNLGGWILDPQHIKPGALMPPTPLSGQELQELLAYLQALK